MIKKIQYIFDSLRANVWPRILAEMLLGFAVTDNFSTLHFTKFLLGFMAVGPLLWSAAYMLNDLTDIQVDSQHILRSKRPIAQGLISKHETVIIISIFTILALWLGFLLGPLFFWGLVVLAMSQVLYTLPPMRLKEVYGWDILLNSLNAAIRFILGYSLGAVVSFNFPIFFFLFAVGFKTILFIGHRLQSRELELKNKYHSTVTLFSKTQLLWLIGGLGIVTGICYMLAIVIDGLGWELLISAFLLIILMIPVIRQAKKGYVAQLETTMSTRNYLYFAILIFSLSILFFRLI